MQFQTKIPLHPRQHSQIDYDSELLLLGSCFTENIGNKLSYYKFSNEINPLGILFHPKAIENLILNTINEKVYTEDELFFHNERWHCFEAHSTLSATTKEALLESLNTAITTSNKQLKKATHIVITLGTAWVYRFIETDAFVSNCHKIPQKKFLKELLTVDEIRESLQAICSLIKSVKTNITIIFTISPVRHLKDGFIQNTQSKSHLISAVHQVVSDERNASYFPSYEIVMDELRDYRFYKEDMIHPSQTTIAYIWEQFSKVWISESANQTMQEVEIIQKGLAHRPFNQQSKQHQAFLDSLQQKMEKLQEAFPFIKF